MIVLVSLIVLCIMADQHGCHSLVLWAILHVIMACETNHSSARVSVVLGHPL